MIGFSRKKYTQDSQSTFNTWYHGYYLPKISFLNCIFIIIMHFGRLWKIRLLADVIILFIRLPAATSSLENTSNPSQNQSFSSPLPSSTLPTRTLRNLRSIGRLLRNAPAFQSLLIRHRPIVPIRRVKIGSVAQRAPPRKTRRTDSGKTESRSFFRFWHWISLSVGFLRSRCLRARLPPVSVSGGIQLFHFVSRLPVA